MDGKEKRPPPPNTMKKAYWYAVRLFQNPMTAFDRLKALQEREVSWNAVFVTQEYYWLVERMKPHTTVLDIGARDLDTAIYFSMFDKVEKVIGYEPNPKIFKEAEKARSQNPFKNKIVLHMNAISNIAKGKNIDENRRGEDGEDFETLKDSGKGVFVESRTLDQALKGLKNVVIKSNCEGAERSIFNEANLDNVYAMEIEYHTNNPAPLIKTLKDKGFRVESKSHGEVNGLIFAER